MINKTNVDWFDDDNLNRTVWVCVILFALLDILFFIAVYLSGWWKR